MKNNYPSLDRYGQVLSDRPSNRMTNPSGLSITFKTPLNLYGENVEMQAIFGSVNNSVNYEKLTNYVSCRNSALKQSIQIAKSNPNELKIP